MGDFNVKPIHNDSERAIFYSSILRDLDALQYMLENDMIEQRSDTIGAEQEMCLVDANGMPKPTALGILNGIEDERFTNELALYNLEINLSPQRLKGDCFSRVESELKSCLELGRRKAKENDSHLFLTGMLPTLGLRHLMFEYMTPEWRYKLLSEELLKLRGRAFEIHLEGVDDFQATLDSVLFEACNTSFQLHLQIAPNDFVRMHNWAQMISGPVISVCANSPMLFGKELWAENRIALFKQSLDTRGQKNHSREIAPRVYFGKKWLQSSPIDLWRENVARFPLLLRGDGDIDPMESLRQGIMPKLKSVGLHNGTTYTWNRLCYGIANNSPHIRIECRYIPSGPSQIDEMANFAFWVGLMKGMPDELSNFWEYTNFKVAKSNFMKASRTGIQTVLHWFGKNYQAKDLLTNVLIPMAQKGLDNMEVDTADSERLLGIIRERALSENTGAQWQKNNFRSLTECYKPSVAGRLMVQESLLRQDENIPVHLWPVIHCSPTHSLRDNLKPNFEYVEDIMNKDVISVHQNVSINVAEKIMLWKGFHHIPVEGEDSQLVGVITLNKLQKSDMSPETLVKEVMTTDVMVASPDMKTSEARDMMLNHKIGSLPVVENEILVGILTKRDFPDYSEA